jgi:type IV pilus assembly protein PilB
MYATIGHVAENVTRKVISVENPVTYSLANVYQIKVDPRAGFGVAAALTSVMGDDADAILIGDIDNAELAHTAVKASRAGHLVIGVITGRDTIDGVRALTEFGVPSDTVASELIAVVGQRLAKRLCPACKTETSLSDELSEAMNWEDGKAFKSKGCEVCEGRGTRGRIAVTEFLEVSPRLRSEISKGNGIDALRMVAQEDGVTTLQMSAQRLVAGGIIPQEELRWTPSWTR